MVLPVIKGAPVPPKYKVGQVAKYPWGALEVGDSFIDPDASLKTMSGNCWHRGKQLGRKFTCRSLPGGGVQVWRVELSES